METSSSLFFALNFVETAERLEAEQSNAPLEFLNYLSRQQLPASMQSVVSGWKQDAAPRAWEIAYDRQSAILLAVFAYTVYVFFVLVEASLS